MASLTLSRYSVVLIVENASDSEVVGSHIVDRIKTELINIFIAECLDCLDIAQGRSNTHLLL